MPSNPITIAPIDRLRMNPLYSRELAIFEKQFASQIDRMTRTFNFALEKLEKKLKSCELQMESYCHAVREKCESELGAAESLVNKELRSKVIMSQWTNKFLAESDTESLDPITFGFARFSLNICLCYEDVPADYFIRSRVHDQLVAYSKFPSEIIVGPAMLGLMHLSLLDEMKPVIVAAGALAVVLKLIAESKSKPILNQICKLIASLALHFPNKSLIVNSGCFHGVLDLILGSHTDVNLDIQYYALCSTVNIIFGSDANRVLAIELKAIKPLVTSIQTTSDNDVLLQSIKGLANIAFCNAYTSGCILSTGGESAVVEVLDSNDVIRQPQIAYAALAMLTNLCCSEASQSHVGSIKGLLESVVRICEHARHAYVSAEAATLLLAIIWNNTANKAKVAAKGTCAALVKRIIRHSAMDDEESIHCIERLCMALASMLLYKANHEKMIDIGGLDEMVRICKQSKQARVIAAVSTVIVTMVPCPNDLYRYHDEETPVPVELAKALSALKKARVVGFGHLIKPPDWLEQAVAVMTMTDEALKRQPKWIKPEYVDRMLCFEEFQTPIAPDATVMASTEFRSLIFSIY